MNYTKKNPLKVEENLDYDESKIKNIELISENKNLEENENYDNLLEIEEKEIEKDKDKDKEKEEKQEIEENNSINISNNNLKVKSSNRDYSNHQTGNLMPNKDKTKKLNFEIEEDTNKNQENNENKELILVNRLKELKCTILEYGTRPIKMKYFFCKCDSNLMEVICEYCAENCHQTEEHSLIIIEKEDYKVCQCGLKNHKANEKNNTFTSKCLYNELSIKSKTYIYFQSENNNILCLFCYNFCKEKQAMPESNFTKKTFDSENSPIQNFPECNCSNSDHGLEKYAPETWGFLYAGSKIGFNYFGLKPAQLLNSIFLSEKSFNNSFLSFSEYYVKLEKLILNNSILDKDFDKNLHLTNYFRCLKAIANISTLTLFWYFTPKAKSFFSGEVLFNFLNKWVADTDSSWSFLNYYLIGFKKLVILPYFNSVPKFRTNDLQNFSPMQRVQIYLTIHSSKDLQEFKALYIDNDSKNIILALINGVESILKTRFTNLLALDCLTNITSLLKVFSQMYLFNNEQMLKFCSVVNRLFFSLLDLKKKTNKHSKSINLIKEKELNILTNIIKTMICFPNIYNDFVIFNHLVKQEGSKKSTIEDLKEISFINSYNEIGKAIAKNTINIIYYVTKDSTRIHKSVRKIINYTTQLIAIFIRENDYFSVGLARDFNEGISRSLKLIFNDFSYEEIEALEFFEKENHKILKTHERTILCEITKQEAFILIKESLDNVVEFLGLNNKDRFDDEKIKDKRVSSYKKLLNNYKSYASNHSDNPLTNLLSKSKQDPQNLSKPNTFNELDLSKSHKQILNKTQLINSIIKSLYLLSWE